jgi:hypothetical protein
MLNSPIIIIGCHRSGTSILTNFLKRNGIILGNDLVGHDESNFFLKINDTILINNKSSWSNPGNLISLIDSNPNKLLRQLSNTIIPFKVRFLFSKFWSFRNILRFIVLKRKWGWKDPRTTITLPIWMKLFPNAKIIHIYRHGFDVANSLYTRECKRNKMDKYFSPNILNFSKAFELWKTYESQALKHTSNISHDRIIRIKYEDFASNPSIIINCLENFLNQKLPNGRDGLLNSNRVFAYKNLKLDKNILEKLNDKILDRLGYEN